LRWDFRRYLNLSIDRIGRDFTYGETVDLILELLRETGSHLYATTVGMQLAGSQAELATIWHAQGWLNYHRDRKKHREPFELPHPVGKSDPNADVTPEMRAELREQLMKRSAFRD
jgi:hypothetical protein